MFGAASENRCVISYEKGEWRMDTMSCSSPYDLAKKLSSLVGQGFEL